MHSWISPSLLGVLIPFLFIAGAIVIAIVAIIIQGRNKDLEHRERLLAMEKGIPLPEPVVKERVKEIKKVKPQRPIHSLRRAWGLVFIGIGLALFIILASITELKYGTWGALPLFIGFGLVLGAALDKRDYEAREKLKGLVE
jgi:hypothetical protein